MLPLDQREPWVAISWPWWRGFPRCSGASGKEPTWQHRRHKKCRFSPWVGKIPWRRHGNPCQYSCLEDPMDRGAWQATVHRDAQSRTQLKQFSMHTHVTLMNWPWCATVGEGQTKSLQPHSLFLCHREHPQPEPMHIFFFFCITALSPFECFQQVTDFLPPPKNLFPKTCFSLSWLAVWQTKVWNMARWWLKFKPNAFN